MAETVCPRCGFKNSFMKGFLPGTCVCKVCQSQLDWREIPGAGPECVAVEESPAGGGKPESPGAGGTCSESEKPGS